MNTKVLVEISAGQNQKKAFPRRRGYLAAWAEQQGRLEGFELPLDLICGRSLSTLIDSLTGKHGGGSSSRWEHR